MSAVEPPPRTILRIAATALGAVAVVAAGLFAWWGVWWGNWVFDDSPAIAANLALQRGDWWAAAFSAPHQPLSNRPLSCLSLAIDFAVFGPGPFGPHLTNILLHLGNGILVWSCVRGAFVARNLAGRWSHRDIAFAACAIATLWVVHPLGADAVAYATQRSTLLASAFLLVACRAALQASASAKPVWWRAAVVVAVACAMASKEDAVVGPILLVLFERAFLVPSWSALRQRMGFFLALASTWIVLGFCVANGPRNPTVGYATRAPVTAFEWLFTQAGVVANYLRLTVWPDPLRGAYDLGIVDRLAPAILPGLFVLCVLATTVMAWRRHPWFGWLGALCFLWLAPTSTVLPIVTEIAAERRMYLPLLFVVVPVVVLFVRTVAQRNVAVRGAAVVLWLGLVLVLGVVTRGRVEVYRDTFTFWDDAWRKRTPGSRTFLAGLLLSNQGDSLQAQGRVEEAGACYDESMRCDGPTAPAIARHAISLLMRGRHDEAIARMRHLARTNDDPNTKGVLGVCLVVAHQAERGKPDDPGVLEAGPLLETAVAAMPGDVQFWSALAYAQRLVGRLAAAEQAYLRVTELEPDHLDAWTDRATVLEQLGRGAEVEPWLRAALAAQPRNVALRVRWAARCAQRGSPADAAVLLREALTIDPAHAEAAAMLRQLMAAQSK